MAFYSPVPVEQQYTVGRSRTVFCCFFCQRNIPPTKLRVKLKRNPYECYCSVACFEDIHSGKYTADLEKKIVIKKEVPVEADHT